MARHIHSRLKVKYELVAKTPLHVGGYGESFETDMALARNGKDEFYIPGTSLTGSLRSWFEKNFPNETEKLWGYQRGDQGHASFVLIEDLQLPEELQSKVQSELRDGVGIERFYGTAADGVKFDRAILPKGTKLNFEMSVEIQNDADKIKAMCGHLLEALRTGAIRLGASKTRGLGKVTFAPTKIEEYLLVGNDTKGIPHVLNLVSGKPTKSYSIQDLINADKETKPQGSQVLTITVKWQPKSALMVKASYEGIGVDMLPLVSGKGDGKVSLVLPGSSIKGAFRAHAERILRTVLGIQAPRNESDSQNFSKQLQVFDKNGNRTKATELIGILFGAKKEAEKSDKLGLGALSINDCYATEGINSELWSAVETGEMDNEKTYSTQSLWHAMRRIDVNKVSEELTEEEKKADTKTFKISHHVAIDRWTGGASEGALFSVLQPSPKMVWENISMTLDLSRIPLQKKDDGSMDDSLRKNCLMLLLLVLRDFAENRLPLGFATNRGMGEVKDVSFAISGAYEVEWKDGKFDFTKPTSLKSDLEMEWNSWLTKQN
jgi:CRISPR/Cas system CSM-associated protein Csm3 (group 7 of RAMP superfamily)